MVGQNNKQISDAVGSQTESQVQSGVESGINQGSLSAGNGDSSTSSSFGGSSASSISGSSNGISNLASTVGKGKPPAPSGLAKMSPLNMLGAGGTSSTNVSESDTGSVMGSKGTSDKLKAGAVGTAVPVVGKMALIQQLLNFMKYLQQLLMAFLTNLYNATVGAALAALQSFVGFFMGIGSSVSAFFGGAVSALAAGSSVAASVVLIPIAIIAYVVVGVDTITRHDALPTSCDVNVEKTIAEAGVIGDASAVQLENAKTVYGVFSAWGMSDENIAGILGNWSRESGIDPTGVEGIYDEPYTLGPKKQDAQRKNFGGYTNGLGKTMTVRGLGLGQWTNGRGQNLLDYASAKGIDWYALETQLGFMISDAEGSDAQVVKDMITTSRGTPEAAAVHFHDKWERSADRSMDARKSAASSWFAQMGGWEKNTVLANSILAQANTALDGAAKAETLKALDKCVGSKLNVDNSSLAAAMVSYSWPYYDDSKGNDGTYLYVWLHEQIFPGDRYFASCDRSVSTSVRWSGSDDTYPAGGVGQQLSYLGTSDKWQKLDWGGDKSNLQPGDLLLRKDGSVSHTVMYVGPDVPLAIWGEGGFEPDTEIASGSLNDRSPGLGRWYGGSTGHGSIMTSSTGLPTYTAWRLVNPDNSDKYSSLKPPSSAKAGDGDRSRHVTP